MSSIYSTCFSFDITFLFHHLLLLLLIILPLALVFLLSFFVFPFFLAFLLSCLFSAEMSFSVLVVGMIALIQLEAKGQWRANILKTRENTKQCFAP